MSKAPITFDLHHRDATTAARAGTIHTLHGPIHTPAFIAVGTKATVKSLTPEQLVSVGAQALLANTYHLHIAPGEDIVSAGGGLATFANWRKSDQSLFPTFTDSGGFQVFSLGEAFGAQVSKVATGQSPTASTDTNKRRSQEKLARIDEDGVSFKSHRDGRLLRFTPEKSMQIQHHLGADIFFAFDECTSPLADQAYQKEALERTHRWAVRCVEYHESTEHKNSQGLFGVVQGGQDPELRALSARQISNLPFAGFGIGGSFNKNDIGKTVAATNELLPADRPRHLLGIGEPADVVAGVAAGCDTFDCVQPTRIARAGLVYGYRMQRMNLKNAKFTGDFSPLVASCDCYTCQNFTRAYLAHLFRSGEMLAATLASIHNLRRIISFTDFIRPVYTGKQFFK